MFIGSFYVVIACLVWGLIFVVPLFMGDYSSVEIALGRYFVYGLVSWIVITCCGFRAFKYLTYKVVKQALLFSLFVNIFYYVMLVLSLKYSDPAIVTLILGLTPISVAFYGNWCRPQFRLSRLVIPSIIIAVGLVLVNVPAFEWDDSKDLWIYLMGLGCAFVALVVWTWYVESNAHFLKENPELPVSEWTSIVGAFTLIWVILLGIGTAIYTGPTEIAERFFVWSEELQYFLIGSVILGLVCAWIGHFFWNKAAGHLHVSVAGQLMIFETVFGLIYVLLVDRTLPTPLEFAGMILMLAGVVASLVMLRQPSAQPIDG